MPTSSFIVKGTKNPANIYYRMSAGRGVDFTVKTGLCINPEFWDSAAKKIRNTPKMTNRSEMLSRLSSIDSKVMEAYNDAVADEIEVSGTWLQQIVFSGLKQRKTDLKLHTIYFSDFAKWWMTEKATGFQIVGDAVTPYNQVIADWEQFDAKQHTELKNMDSGRLQAFSEYLYAKHAHSTVRRKVSRIRFFCSRAEKENLEVHKGYSETIRDAAAKASFKKPYLSEEEIERIFSLDLSGNDKLQNDRDNFIIGLRTGLRVSDFLVRLNIENLDGEFIDIRTKKTGHYVSIPLHTQIKSVLKKRNGAFPEKTTSQQFNKNIKKICRLAKIDCVMDGEIIENTELGRKKKPGAYAKYKLVTSHICRRSMATNLLGKVPNKVIMDVCGWVTEQQMFAYNQSTNRESAIILKNHWESNN